MTNEYLHTPVFEETEITCDSCGCIVGYYQWTDEKFVNSKCSKCNDEIKDVLKTYCLKCRMGSN